MLRRPRGEAADMIVKAVAQARPEGLSLNELRKRTGLAVPTLRDNVRALAKAGRVVTCRDEDRAIWVMLQE